MDIKKTAHWLIIYMSTRSSDEGITILIYIYWSLLYLNGWFLFFVIPVKCKNDRVLCECLLKMVLMSPEVVSSFVNFNGFLELIFTRSFFHFGVKTRCGNSWVNECVSLFVIITHHSLLKLPEFIVSTLNCQYKFIHSENKDPEF